MSRRDVYKRLAAEEGWRARSAYKIMQIDEEIGLFRGCNRIVDLCCAPGSWSQVAARKIPESSERKIIAIDLREIEPIDGVTCLVGDITCEITARKVVELMEGNLADLVMSDGAPDIIGRIEFDEYVQHSIVRASLAIATMILRPGGTFVSKIFRTRNVSSVFAQLGCFFKEVMICKPRASRLSSVESFVVCRGFEMPDGYTPTLVTGKLPTGPVPTVRFVQCGDVYGPDSERTYPLSQDMP